LSRTPLRRWAAALGLRDEHGEPVGLSPHAFRHTYATGLINNDVDLFSVQSLLDHDSPEMTWRYARLSNQTLRRKWGAGPGADQHPRRDRHARRRRGAVRRRVGQGADRARQTVAAQRLVRPAATADLPAP